MNNVPTISDAALYGFAFVFGAGIAQATLRFLRNWRSFLPKKHHAYYCHCDRCLYDERQKGES